MRGLCRYFPGIKALDGVDFSMRPGEVHALIGENGAGKSTLVKVLTGVYRPTAGRIVFEGVERDFRSPVDSQNEGIAAIHQEAIMFPELSITENIFSGHLLRKKSGLLDWAGMRAKTVELLARLELPVDPEALVIELSVAQRHLVQIARSLSMDARLVIMDEPTSALSMRETEDLFRIIRQLKAEGKAILFISHKFDEIFAICDSYTVLRDGKYIGSGLVKDVTLDALVQMMAGRPLTQMFPKHVATIGEPVLEVEGFCQGSSFRDVSFTLHKGEILGMFGLVGAGRSEVIRALIGVDPLDSGRIRLKGRTVRIANPREALRLGLACVPEDRQGQGLVLPMSISHNITLPQVGSLGRAGFRNDGAEAALTEEYGKKMEIRSAGWKVEAATLSGGNQQKVVLAKWLATKPSILILDEPTKGIDVGTKAAVHEFVSELAEGGMSIIMISSELPEILGMSDRIIVMHEGRIAAAFDRADATEEKVIMAATGSAESAPRSDVTRAADAAGAVPAKARTKKPGGRA